VLRIEKKEGYYSIEVYGHDGQLLCASVNQARTFRDAAKLARDLMEQRGFPSEEIRTMFRDLQMRGRSVPR